MRYFVKTTPANEERRRQLLKKLVMFKGVERANVKATLRNELEKCEGHKAYYFEHRGLTVYIGDDETPKKQFLIYKNEMLFGKFIRKLRENLQLKPVNKSKFIRETGEYWTYQTKGGVFEQNGVIAQKDHDIRRCLAQMAKKPKTNDAYIGIELEYASKHSVADLRNIVAEMRLHKQVRIVRDESIEVNSSYPFKAEICVLSKYSELGETMNKLSKFITPERFWVNQTCGLHVHLDARNDDVCRMYKNLVSSQALLFRMVDKSRRNNRYCHPVSSPNFTDPFDDDHYAAISKLSFQEHRSIEVRIHQSTLDLNMIEKWIHLLKLISDCREPLVFQNYFDFQYEQLKTQMKPTEDLLKYVEERLVS